MELAGLDLRTGAASGTYQGACRVDRLQEFTKWRARPSQVVVDTLDLRTWEDLADPRYWTGCWGPDRKMVYGVGMIPSKDGGSLAAGARGEYDRHFRRMAEHLVKGGHGSAWLRLGFEFNGAWFPWTAKGQPEVFAAYYRRIVDVVRSVPGADFSFVWNPTVGLESVPAERAWPGRGYVDAIGLDLYDVSWAPGSYPVPGSASSEQASQRRERAWQHYVQMDHGLDWWARYAAQQRLPLALPEWGLVQPEHHGGGDNPLFVERVHAWLRMNDVAFESYFNAAGLLGDHRLDSQHFPRAAATYRRLFGS